jgi:hypothetical protein
VITVPAKRTRKRFVLLTVFGLSIAIVAVVTQAGLGGEKKITIGNGSVSALGRSAGPGDALPAEVLALPFAEKNFASATGAGSRLVRADGALQLYVVPGKGRLLCLIEVNASLSTSGGACADRKSLLTGSIYMADRREDGSGQWDVVGLVGDGHTYAQADGQRVAVRNNAFVLRGVDAEELTLGSTTATQTVDIGP